MCPWIYPLDNTRILLNKKLIDEAADWYARLDSGVADLAKFEAWRDGDPQRAVAFARIVAAVTALDGVRELAHRRRSSKDAQGEGGDMDGNAE